MRKLISFCLFFFCIAGLQAAINIKRIDPAFWWCGMKNKELQIMVYGDKIGDAKASLKYPGVTLEKTVRLDSPNYLFLYLNISDNAKPGKMTIRFDQGKEHTSTTERTRPGLYGIRCIGRTVFDHARPICRWRPENKCNTVHAVSCSCKS